MCLNFQRDKILKIPGYFFVCLKLFWELKVR